MSVHRIDGLRVENWQNLSTQKRLEGLQELENSLAAQENRTPCKVAFIPEEAYKKPEDHQLLQGYHEGKGIFLNENLIASDRPSSDKPYNAVETLFHESRHDYQEHLASQPETAEDSQQLQDFRMNTSGGYLKDEVYGYDKYRWQPIEKDANEVARQRTDELYANEFDDKSTYTEYRQQVEQNLSDDMFNAQEHLGNDYIEQARESMAEQFKQSQSVNQQTGLSDTYPQGEVPDTLSSGIQPDAKSQNVDEKAANSADEVDGRAVEDPTGLASSKVAEDVSGYAQDASHEPSDGTTQTASEELSKDSSGAGEKAAESAGEIVGEAAGVPGGAEAGKAASQAAGETQGVVEDSTGQSLKSRTGSIEETAAESPSADASQPDEEQYYGYGL
jgi:hypothetical protein